MNRFSLALAWISLGFIACASNESPVDVEPALSGDGPLDLGAFFAVRDESDRVWVGALAGANPEELELSFDAGDGERHAFERGAFGNLEADALVGERIDEIVVRDSAGTELARLRVRDAAMARASAVRPDLGGAGSVPNDLIIVGAGSVQRGLVVRSGDNAINTFNLATGLAEDSPGVRLPAVEGRDGPVPANPWFATAIGDRNERVAVTAFAQARVYVIDLEHMQVEHVFGPAPAVRLEAPYALRAPFDVDGDGVSESEVRSFVPRGPQGLVVVGDELWVAFSGFLAPRLAVDRPPVYLPAVVVRWNLSDPSAPASTLTLPFANPQELREINGLIFVSCSGVIDPGSGSTEADDQGLVVIDPTSARVERTIPMPGFAPSSVIGSVTGDLWVSSLLRAEVRRSSPDGTLLDTLVLNDEEVDSIFRLTALPGGLIAAPSFNTDRLHIIDPVHVVSDPPPFFAPLEIGPGRPLFDGLQIVARRPGRAGVDFVGPDLFALSGIASRIVPIELRKVLGP